jgi:ATP-binding cassette subfamily F protein 3
MPSVFFFGAEIMLKVQNISKSFGVDNVLSQISFTLNAGERLALVGPNGCGKTTLIRILMGLEKAGSGTVLFDPPDIRVGYLPQGFDHWGDETVAGYINRLEGDLEGLSAQLELLAMALGDDPDQPDILDEYDAVLVQLQIASEMAGTG